MIFVIILGSFVWCHRGFHSCWLAVAGSPFCIYKRLLKTHAQCDNIRVQFHLGHYT